MTEQQSAVTEIWATMERVPANPIDWMRNYLTKNGYVFRIGEHLAAIEQVHGKQIRRGYFESYAQARGCTTCSRCGGAGGWHGWPGFTCRKCGGHGMVKS